MPLVSNVFSPAFDPIDTLDKPITLFWLFLLLLLVSSFAFLAGWWVSSKKNQRIIQKQKEAIQQLYTQVELSSRDRLTGAMTQDQILPLLEERILQARKKNQVFVLIFIDLDDFKRINDRYTHPIGSVILGQVARILIPRSPNDLFFRYGGDEFLVVSSLGQDLHAGMGFAERLRRDVAETEFIIQQGSSPVEKLTISCGVTEVDLQKDDPQTLLNRVAEALRLAKQPHNLSDGTRVDKNTVFAL